VLTRDEVAGVRAESELLVHQCENEAARLKAQVRGLSEDRDIGEVFRGFEAELNCLSRENEGLHKQLSQAKLRALRGESDDRSFINTSHGKKATAFTRSVILFSSISTGSYKSSLSRPGSTGWAAQQLKRDGKEREIMRRELEALRKQERLHAVAVRISEDLQKKLRVSHTNCSRATAELAACRESHARLESDLSALQEDSDRLRKSHADLRVERARHLEELALLRAVARETDTEQKREKKLDRFAAKHRTTEEITKKAMAIPGLAGNSDAQVYGIFGLYMNVSAMANTSRCGG
jgi:hypothetical protein